MIRIGSDTNIAKNRNSSNWLVMNFNLVLSSEFCLNWSPNIFLYTHGNLNSEWNNLDSPETEKNNFLLIRKFDLWILVFDVKRIW